MQSDKGGFAMARSRSRRRQARALDTLLEKGVIACIIGAALLAAPWFTRSSPLISQVAANVRPLGWVLLAIGAALLLAHRLVRRNNGAEASAPTVQRMRAPSRTARSPAPPAGSDRPLPSPYTPAHADAFDGAAPAGTAGAPPVPEPEPVRQPAARWGPKVFAAIEWRRFEAVCEALFAQAGFRTRAQSHGADGGVDIWLYSAHSEGPAAVVQCKHWQGKPVGVREMREFYGVMAAHKLQRGTYATTSTYTEDALQFAKDNGISALDGKRLLSLIAQRTEAQQQALLQVAFEGEYWRPTCASCGTKMVERKRSRDGARFWACSHHPRCNRTLPMAS